MKLITHDLKKHIQLGYEHRLDLIGNYLNVALCHIHAKHIADHVHYKFDREVFEPIRERVWMQIKFHWNRIKLP